MISGASVLIITDNDADGLASSFLIESVARSNHNKVTKIAVPQQAFKQAICDIDFNTFDGVFVADLSLDEQTCDMLFERFGSNFLVFDHHASASWLNDKPYAVYDTSGEYAACMLVYESFSVEPSAKIDIFYKLVEYISDRDVWQFKLHASKEVNTWISTVRMDDIKCFEDTAYQINNNLDNVIKLGRAIIGHVNNTAFKYIRRFGEGKSKKIVVKGIDIPVFNNTNDISEVLHQFLEYTNLHIAASYFLDENLDIIVSLRSNDGSAKDIAVTMGGGGHPNAAGFKVSISEFRKMVV